MKVNVVLNLRSTSNAQVLIDAAHYTTNMTGNALFAAAEIVAEVAATVAATTALQTAMNAPTSDTKTDTIKVARETLDRNLNILAGKVVAVANDPALADDQRTGVIHSAGMEVKAQALKKKNTFAVTQGDAEGSMHLIAPGGASAHEWQYTSDIVNLTGRTAAVTTTKSSTDINGLRSGTKYAFFHKSIVPGVITDWEGPLFGMVL